MRLLALALFLSVPASAQDQARRDAVALLRLEPPAGSTAALPTWRLAFSGYAPLGTIELARLGALPHGRRLVTAVDKAMARVVTNLESGGGLWLDLDGLRRSSWTVELTALDALAEPPRLVDVFALWDGPARPLCPAPGEMDACARLPREDAPPARAVEQRGGYLRLEGLGWVSVRDPAGRLSVVPADGG